MVKVCIEKFPEKNGYYMDGYIKANLDLAKKAIRKDWDMIFIVDGLERGGKSVFTQQCAYYCDNSFNVDRVCFTPREFEEAVLKAKPYQAVVFDEAFVGLSARRATSKVNHSLVKMLSEIGQKNLFIFIVLPCFFELDKYPAIWRSRALFHVYTGDNFQRGNVSMYDYERKKNLYVYGKKFLSYTKSKPNFIGSFTNFYVLNEKKYRRKKLNSLKEHEQEMPEELMSKEESVRSCLLYYVHKENTKNFTEISRILKEMGIASLEPKAIGIAVRTIRAELAKRGTLQLYE
jgi:hypothetical protein